ncbi:transcriptional regulator, IclR family [Jatrophihabitans endophyticus]|uniref:Transcriptional regulator, IclR family n=1 Tax=Jatrophihabitans endophyticus TaxID=1206085 RepID=A0A1M5N7U8_9ACTN|nr:IclR family transcriptional regulator [Jatrophihabitans endophyticus]SHG85545.1 transcriptional regulator, IclR family [Jatrophihabitans endophyticus]
MTASTGTQAVDRAAQLLRVVVEADAPISFTELVEESGLARSTVSRLLSALEANHLLERNGGGGYRSGALFAMFAARHDPWSQVARLADPILDAVVTAVGETVNLAIPRGGTVVQVAQADSAYVLSARDWSQIDVPPHVSALGKVFFAHEALPLPTGALDAWTDRSLTSADELDKQLASVRRKGYAVTRGELEIGLDAVAAPVRGPGGDVVAALGVSGPSARLDGRLDDIGRQLIEHATSVSELLRPKERRKGVA